MAPWKAHPTLRRRGVIPTKLLPHPPPLPCQPFGHVFHGEFQPWWLDKLTPCFIKQGHITEQQGSHRSADSLPVLPGVASILLATRRIMVHFLSVSVPLFSSTRSLHCWCASQHICFRFCKDGRFFFERPQPLYDIDEAISCSKKECKKFKKSIC